MRLFSGRICQGMWLAAWVVLATSGLATAQATSTFNGRVLDQGDAVLPGVTVTATNTNTGVMRTTVTNDEGQYSMPGLEPGVYDVRTELAGFSTAVRERVTLILNATITLDFRLALAGVEETLTVTGQAPLIETTQSKFASTIETTELQSLPMITRSINGMLELMPGATPMTPIDNTKRSVGNVSFGGSSGTNVSATVDGADNRDPRQGGTLMNFTLDSLEQFQLATSQFSAADGRTGGVAISMITKSGTNVFHGSGFIFGRDKALTAKDYFSKQDNLDEVPYSRQQWGGSIGGPIIRNRMFFFGAGEYINEDTSLPVPTLQFNEMEALVTATNTGNLPPGLINPNHPHSGATPLKLTMYSLKTNLQLNNAHQVMVRFAGQEDTRLNNEFTQPNNDLREPVDSFQDFWSLVGQHGWVLGNRGLNQLTGHVSHHGRLSDVHSVITGEHYTRDFPNVDYFPARLSFPAVNTGAGGTGGATADVDKYQIRDDVSLLTGSHGMKFGANYTYLPHLGTLNNNEHFATFFFFDDPSVILSNRNGLYPQGFQTPGIVRQWQQAVGGALNGVGFQAESRKDASQFSAWFQDDWRATSRLTLNLGVRYDLDTNLWDQENLPNSATRLALEGIGHPQAALPENQYTNISPRVGFAYDLAGDGRRVLRGGYGLYFDQINQQPFGDISSQTHRPLNVVSTLINTSIGVGQLANYRFGIDPEPPQPTDGSTLPPGSLGQWIGSDIVDPRVHHMHIGYAHELGTSTMFSVDYTRQEGRRGLLQLNINPIVNGVRVLAPDFLRVYGRPNVLNQINVKSSIGESQLDMLTFKFQRRLPRTVIQAHYTLQGAYAHGGSIAARGGTTVPSQDPFDPLAEGEWGPTLQDERHRLVATGVFDLPYGIQLSPVFQTASARPYNLTAGSDLNRDGVANNDRWVDPATGQAVAINAGRGDPTVVLDLRATKFFALGGDWRLGALVEIFNVLDNVNLGGDYQGNGRSALFRQPLGGFIPGIGYPRQLQLGARLIF